MTEKQLQAAVLKLAKLRGWMAYHTYDSRKSQAGFPDLVLVRPPDLLFVELKSEKGVVSLAQEDWLLRLQNASVMRTRLWRPRDWTSGLIERTLI